MQATPAISPQTALDAPASEVVVAPEAGAVPTHGPIAGPYSAAPAAIPGTFASLVQTTKPGIVRLVTITSMVGFVMAAVQHSWEWPRLAIDVLACVLGTALSAAGANSINQFVERRRDALMTRTAKRPLPSGRVTPASVLWFGIALGVIGCAILVATGHAVSSLIAATCLLVYIFAYTPMKPHTTTATFVGAIPGALPPLIGWTAASNARGFDSLAEPGGWTLFALMFVWQIPHFLAIAWMYKDDYAKGGYAVLPARDPTGGRTAITIALWTGLLLPTTLLPAFYMPRSLGSVYIAVAIISGLGFMFLAFRLIRSLTRTDARKVFFASIIYLPVLMIAMVAEALVRVLRG